MGNKRQNSPFVFWSTCFLWIVSLFAITWSILLFFCVGDILLLTGTDMVNSFVLLSGIVMLPTNIHMLYSISMSRKIDHKSKVVCCPLWMCIFWIVLVNIVGAVLCARKIIACKETTDSSIQKSIKHYRSVPQYKHFIDNVQWSMRCCGLNSYRDWFTRDWYDKIRDYEWDPAANKRNSHIKVSEVDSVPLSCCKSGSCISNYLTELGTYSIHTSGCGRLMHRIIMISMITHLSIFVTVVVVELLILNTLIKQSKKSGIVSGITKEVYNVKQIMQVKENFDASSCSYQVNPEDSDDDMDSIKHYNMEEKDQN